MRPSQQLAFSLAVASAATSVWANPDSEVNTDNNEQAATSWKPTSIKFSADSFLEQFASPDVIKSSWSISEAIKQTDVKEDDAEKDSDLYRYKGEWQVEEPTVLVGTDPKDYGLVLKTPASHHAISKKLNKPIVFKGKKHITIQYEVKLQNVLECGGAYMKLLKQDDAFVASKFSDSSPYSIMFGPDRCGSNNKVHFIFRFKNLKSGKTEEHHLKNPPVVDTTSKKTHVYTLRIFPEDNKYEVLIDNKSERKGSFYEDFEPAVVPSKEIDDPNDKKPADWVDEAQIPDPDAKKPEDWDETAPYEIEDLDAEIPNDWLVDEPEYVADPESVKPADWDDEEDGEWIAPRIANPKCAKVSGCGAWKRPMKKNPDYKGKWNAPLIDNPAYKGHWAPAKIDNPDWFDEKHVGEKLLSIGAIGFELWTMQSDILFDNILITPDEFSVVDSFISETFTLKQKREDKLSEVNEPKKDSPLSPESLFANMRPVAEQFSLDGLNQFLQSFHLRPVEVAQEMPLLLAALILVALALPLRFLFGILFSSSSEKITTTKDASKKKNDDADENESDEKESKAVKFNKTSPLKQRNTKIESESEGEESE